MKLLLALMLCVIMVSAVKVSPKHEYLLGSNYRSTWSPNFSGWNRMGTGSIGGWAGRNSAYATSWMPNFSGWGRRLWNHNAENDVDHDSIAYSRVVDPTWNPNFSGFRRPVSPFSRTIIRRSIIRNPTWHPNFSGIRRTVMPFSRSISPIGYNSDPTWNPNFSGIRRYY